MSRIEPTNGKRSELMLPVIMLLATLIVAPSLATAQFWQHPFHLPQPDTAPSRLLAVVEIPIGSRVKYEIDADHGGLMVDRILQAEYAYPAHYGGLPSVWGADGDLMDVLIISDATLLPGALIEVIPIGLAKMTDEGLADDKVLAIPAREIGRQLSGAPELSVVDPKILAAIEQFFKGYKASGVSSNPIDWQGFADVAAFRQWWSMHAIGHVPDLSSADARP